MNPDNTDKSGDLPANAQDNTSQIPPAAPWSPTTDTPQSPQPVDTAPTTQTAPSVQPISSASPAATLAANEAPVMPGALQPSGMQSPAGGSLESSQQAVPSAPQPLSQPISESPPIAVHDTSQAPSTVPEVQTSPLTKSTKVGMPKKVINGFVGSFGAVVGRFKKMKGKQRIIILAAAVLAIALAVFGIMQLFSSSNVGPLIDDTKTGVSFKRPKNWTFTKEEDGLMYFTKDGQDISKANLGLIVSRQDLGMQFTSLSEDNKVSVKQSFTSGFSSKEAFANDECEEIKSVSSTETTQTGYDLVFRVEAECAKLKGSENGGRVKMFIGWTKNDLHVVGVVADSGTWDADAKKLDAILTSIKPQQ